MPTQTMAGQRFAMILVNITLIVGLVCLIASLSHLSLTSGNHGVSTKISERSTEINETARLDFFEAHSDSLLLTGIAKRALLARDDTDSEEDDDVIEVTRDGVPVPKGGHSQNIGSSATQGEGVAGPAYPPQGHPWPQGTAAGGSSNVLASSPIEWAPLVLRSWSMSLPLMFADIPTANRYLETMSNQDEPQGGWQKDNRVQWDMLSNELKSTKKHYWSLSRAPQFNLEPIRNALSALGLPGTNPRSGVTQIISMTPFRWLQDGPIKWTRPGFDVKTFAPTNAEFRALYGPNDGIIVILQTMNMKQAFWNDPNVRAFAARAHISMEDMYPGVTDMAQFLSFDWQRVGSAPVLDTRARGRGPFPLGYIVFQSVRLEEKSLKDIKGLLESYCGKHHHTLRPGPQGARYKVGDYRYNAILALPEFEWLASLLAERKTQFGRAVFSEVHMFRADGDDADTLSFIWKVQNTANVKQGMAFLRHYAFMKTAVEKGLVSQNTMNEDSVMRRIGEREQAIVAAHGPPFPKVELYSDQTSQRTPAAGSGLEAPGSNVDGKGKGKAEVGGGEQAGPSQGTAQPAAQESSGSHSPFFEMPESNTQSDDLPWFTQEWFDRSWRAVSEEFAGGCGPGTESES